MLFINVTVESFFLILVMTMIKIIFSTAEKISTLPKVKYLCSFMFEVGRDNVNRKLCEHSWETFRPLASREFSTKLHCILYIFAVMWISSCLDIFIFKLIASRKKWNMNKIQVSKKHAIVRYQLVIKIKILLKILLKIVVGQFIVINV